MNESQENHVFFGRTCKVTESSFVLLNQFPNKTYERSHVATLVINYILILMNGISIVTIRKSSQLRNKVCYFVILLQSIVDLSVGVLTIPLFIYYLMVPFVNTVNCTLIIFALRTLYLPLGLSITTLSAMALVRYIGVLHPFQYKTKVTKKRILIYVCGHGLAFISAIAYSFRNPDVIAIYTRGGVCVLFLLFGFVYTRIYLVIRKLIRSERRPVCESYGIQFIGSKLFVKVSVQDLEFFVFFLLFLPMVFSRFAFTVGSVDYTMYFNWSLTMIILNSSINSAIFFWTKHCSEKKLLKP